MMNVDMPNENECQIRRNRIKMYKSILNYYKGRSLSLNLVQRFRQQSVHTLPDVKSYSALRKDIQGLQDDIMLIQSIKNCLSLVNYSLASTELMGTNDMNIKRASLQKTEGIIFFSNSIMKLYRECSTELELLNKMKDYSATLDEYMKSLERVKENQHTGDSQESQETDKLELQIYKINLMRIMKSVLIGYVSLNSPDLLQNVQRFKSSFRRDLTIDDFTETSDVGL